MLRWNKDGTRSKWMATTATTTMTVARGVESVEWRCGQALRKKKKKKKWRRKKEWKRRPLTLTSLGVGSGNKTTKEQEVAVSMMVI
jgi:hypothetical protein